MRVSLHAALAAVVVVVVLARPGFGQAAAPKPILNHEQGFSLSVPAGWSAAAAAGAAAAMARTDNAQVKATVMVTRESAPTDVTETLAKALAAIGTAKGQTLVSSSFDVYLDRAALFAVFEDATTRYRMVLVPREYEERSQVYYRFTVAAPKAAFAKLATAFDRVFTGFAILDHAAATKAVAGGAAPTAAPVPTGFDRNAAIERLLSPLKRPGG
ncbi:MAG: hypothetical protein Q8T13_01360 [Acidobacteriota bacterium]|nr:hypothetical protein [Acidobacteriota bacterium]